MIILTGHCEMDSPTSVQEQEDTLVISNYNKTRLETQVHERGKTRVWEGWRRLHLPFKVHFSPGNAAILIPILTLMLYERTIDPSPKRVLVTVDTTHYMSVDAGFSAILPRGNADMWQILWI